MLYTLTHLCCVADFPNIQAAYTLKGWLYVLLGKGYKSALYLWGKSLVIQDVV